MDIPKIKKKKMSSIEVESSSEVILRPHASTSIPLLELADKARSEAKQKTTRGLTSSLVPTPPVQDEIQADSDNAFKLYTLARAIHASGSEATLKNMMDITAENTLCVLTRRSKIFAFLFSFLVAVITFIYFCYQYYCGIFPLNVVCKCGLSQLGHIYNGTCPTV